MSGAFALAAMVMAADPNAGRDGTYSRTGAAWSPITLRVVLSRPVQDVLSQGVGARLPAAVAEIPAAALPSGVTPQRGDQLLVNGVTYRVETPELDVVSAWWRLQLGKS